MLHIAQILFHVDFIPANFSLRSRIRLNSQFQAFYRNVALGILTYDYHPRCQHVRPANNITNLLPVNYRYNKKYETILIPGRETPLTMFAESQNLETADMLSCWRHYHNNMMSIQN